VVSACARSRFDLPRRFREVGAYVTPLQRLLDHWNTREREMGNRYEISSSGCKPRKISSCAGLARDLAQIVPEPIFGIPRFVKTFRY
jgi:hypothetical protein